MIKKKFIVSIFTVLIVCISSVTFAAVNPFSDVPESHWAYDDVTNLAANGIISPYEDGTFMGNKNATRYDVAVMVANLYVKKTGEDFYRVENPFSDVPKNHWAADAITTLVAYGVEKGEDYNDGTFRGNREITHGELRNLLNNLFEVIGVESRMKDNKDNEDKPLTRYELAATLNRVYEVLFS